MKYGMPQIETNLGNTLRPEIIENMLLHHPAVQEAGVIFLHDTEGDRYAKAFVSLRKGYNYSFFLIEELKKISSEQLPAGIGLEEVEIKDRLPRTKSGKILREMLKSWECTSETISIAVH